MMMISYVEGTQKKVHAKKHVPRSKVLGLLSKVQIVRRIIRLLQSASHGRETIGLRLMLVAQRTL